MKIVILGAGKMGSFFADVLSFDHEIALYDIDPHRLRFAFNTLRMTRPEEIQDFTPDLVINAATVKYTIEAFQTVLPYLPASHNPIGYCFGQDRITRILRPSPTPIRIDTPYVRTDIR